MGIKLKIWVVDDERIIRVTTADDLRDAGYDVYEFTDAASMFNMLREDTPDLVITDIKMPGMDGIELLMKLKKIKNEVSVLMMTAFGTIENAVKAMKLGASDFITKPFTREQLLVTVEKILRVSSLQNENKILRKQIRKKYDFSTYVGDSDTNKELFDQIKLVAKKDSTVLITGETGTGKELVTNIIHFNSDRKNKPLVKVSCAVLSREIFESELFGHIKGAFTGADTDKQGRFELANMGTLYLDDIDDIPMDLQVKLLRAIENREIEKVGSPKIIPINIRLIASTKKDLLSLVNEGKFRKDLYYRLNIFPIRLLPLRERKKDIERIIWHYLNEFSHNRHVGFTKEAFHLLINYNWPGNIRELKNIAERFSIIAENREIDVRDIPPEIRSCDSPDVKYLIGSKPLNQLLSDIEVESIEYALEKNRGNKTKAAEILGIPVSTLRTKMDKYGL